MSGGVSVVSGHIYLFAQLCRRDISMRYRGSTLGSLWVLLNPLFMLSLYTFVFSVVFQPKWATGNAGDFALSLFAGLVTFNFVAEVLAKSPHLIVGNPSYVKKVVFPLSLLPLVAVGSAIFHFFVSLCALIGAVAVLRADFHVTIVCLPLVILPMVFYAIALSWFISALGVYLRDIGQIVGLLTTVLMFMSPVFYPASALPESMRWISVLNPIAVTIGQVRMVTLEGAWPHADVLLLNMVISLVLCVLAFKWFAALRKGFADVL